MSYSMLITQTDTSVEKHTQPYQGISGQFKNIALVSVGGYRNFYSTREVEHICIGIITDYPVIN